jgi:hypothetical protein
MESINQCSKPPTPHRERERGNEVKKMTKTSTEVRALIKISSHTSLNADMLLHSFGKDPVMLLLCNHLQRAMREVGERKNAGCNTAFSA